MTAEALNSAELNSPQSLPATPILSLYPSGAVSVALSLCPAAWIPTEAALARHVIDAPAIDLAQMSVTTAELAKVGALVRIM